ncbi:MAG: M23 family metallopeptidase [Deltaproteobacteria bacterium]|nr:M23 family metallopeptidase [Deltaproteobacteria bacterium]
MRKNISCLIYDQTGSPIKHVSVSRAIIKSFYIFAIIGIAAVIAFVAHYASLTKTESHAMKLAQKVSDQQAEISHQQLQIQGFAEKINQLKSELAVLGEFEQKMRIIANFDSKDPDQEGIFGVGGSLPADMNGTDSIVERQSSLVREMHENIEHLNIVTTSQHERFQKLFNHMEEQRNLLAATPTIRPVEGGWISSSFGYRKSPFTNRREFHKGLDIATKHGAPIVSPAQGVITFAGKKGLFGKTLVIDHGYGVVTRYGHVSKFDKKRGDKVKRGDIIARVGNTGRSTGPHVHYEVLFKGVQVNPKKYILN